MTKGDYCHTHNAVSQLCNIRGLDDLGQITSGISVLGKTVHFPKQTVASPVVLHPVLRHNHTIVSINLGTTNKVVNAVDFT